MGRGFTIGGDSGWREGGDSSFVRAYSELYCHDNAVAQTLTLADTYYVVTAFDAIGAEKNAVGDHSANTITIARDGVYHVTGSLSFNGSANAEFEFGLFVGGVEATNIDTQRKLGAAADIGSVSLSGLLSLVSGEVLDLRAKCIGAAAKAITVVHGGVSITRV